MKGSLAGTSLALLVSAATWLASAPAPARSDWDADDELYRGRAWDDDAGEGEWQASDARAHVLRLLSEARAQRDVIRVVCLNDKLTQIDAALRMLEERGEGAHDPSVRAAALERIRMLDQEASTCVGEDISDTAATSVRMEIHAASRRVTSLPPVTTGSGAGPGRDARMAQAPSPAQPEAPPLPSDDVEPSGAPILVYRASLRLAVFEIEERQRQVLVIAEELGGVLHEQTESHIIVRVPAPRFREALERMEGIGEVRARHVQARDVTEEHTDLRIRLENAEQTRDRLLALLARASAVDDILNVQRELERVTLLVEQLRGRLRFLDDRIAMSMIRVMFESSRSELAREQFRVPAPWLQELGLTSLLDFSAIGGSTRYE